MNARIIRRANVRLGRDAHFAHLVHIFVRNNWSCTFVCRIEFAQHRFIISRISLSVIITGVYRQYIILPFVADGKISPSRAHVATFPHFSCQSLHPLRLSSICFFVVRQTEKQKWEERQTKRASNPSIHWRTIRNFYQRKFCAVCPQSREDTSVLSSRTFKSYFSLLSRQLK